MLWGGGLVLAGLAFWQRDVVVAGVELAAGAVTDLFARGARLNHTQHDAIGVVPDDPDELVAEAEAVMAETIGRNSYALGRMGRSEGEDGMIYRMHVALNDLADLQDKYGDHIYSSLWALMLHSKNAQADGHFSEQYLGKRYATTRDPYEGDIRLARAVMTDHAAGIDPTGGATKFVDKNAFVSQPGATGSYEEKRDEWIAAGLEPVEDLPGASSNFVIFRAA